MKIQKPQFQISSPITEFPDQPTTLNPYKSWVHEKFINRNDFDKWFDENITGCEFYDPEKVVKVTGCECIGDRYLYYDSVASEASCLPAKHHTHKALLVNIEPLRREND